MPNVICWQDWVLSDGVFNDISSHFKRSRPPRTRPPVLPPQQFQATITSASGASSTERTLALNADVVAEILAATHAMPSWKACVVEGTSWDGTAEENIQKYVSSIGTDECP